MSEAARSAYETARREAEAEPDARAYLIQALAGAETQYGPSGDDLAEARALVDVFERQVRREAAARIRSWHDRLPGEHACCDGNAADLIDPDVSDAEEQR